jgi:hypothetical protein
MYCRKRFYDVSGFCNEDHEMRHRFIISCFTLCCLLGLASAGIGQTKTSKDHGFYLWEKFQGNWDDSGRVSMLDTSLGYRFGQHFSLGGGIPINFVNAADSTSSTNTGSTNGIGNAYLCIKFEAKSSETSFSSTLTATAPTGDTESGLSTGRATMDWINYLQYSFNRISPFVSAGFANSIVDAHFFAHPFTTLGNIAHFEGGTDFDIGHAVSVGGSLYADVPFGQQKVFSKLVKRNAKGKAKGLAKHKVFETQSLTSGDASIDRDNGISAWMDWTPKPLLAVEFGYSRSVKYTNNSFFCTISLDLGLTIRAARHL